MVLIKIPSFDFSSINSVLQLLALLLALIGLYYYRTEKSKNKTLIDLYKLAKTDDVSKLINDSKSIINVPDKLTKKQQYDLIKEQINRKHRQYQLRVVVIIIAILSFFACVIFLIVKPVPGTKPKSTSQISYTDSTPTVLGIYPSDAFGPDQKRGLHEVLEHCNLGIQIIDLDFLPFKDMKEDKVSRLIDSVKKLLKSKNIIGIVGPSISECTENVLQIVYREKSRVPVFITTAAPSDFLHWNSYVQLINPFRIGSSIDRRADLISKFLQNHNITTHSLFIVEDNSPQSTFGKMYFDALMQKSEELRNAQITKHIEVLRYKTEDAENIASLSESEISKYDYIFVLGVGKRFTSIIDKYYGPKQKNLPRPKIGGWMNAYSLNKYINLSKSFFINNKIFEITDINLGRASNMNAEDDSYLNDFQTQMQSPIHPGLRDIAITYDAGICIIESYKALLKNVGERPGKFINFGNYACDSLSHILHSMPFEAISSKIIFDKNGVNENIGMDCAIFDSSSNTWRHIDLPELLKL